MKYAIAEFCKKASKRYGLTADYLAGKDLYRLLLHGKAVMMFYTDNFYEIPPRMRLNHIQKMIVGGLALNLGEKSAEGNWQKHHGKKIV